MKHRLCKQQREPYCPECERLRGRDVLASQQKGTPTREGERMILARYMEEVGIRGAKNRVKLL